MEMGGLDLMSSRRGVALSCYPRRKGPWISSGNLLWLGFLRAGRLGTVGLTDVTRGKKDSSWFCIEALWDATGRLYLGEQREKRLSVGNLIQHVFFNIHTCYL